MAVYLGGNWVFALGFLAQSFFGARIIIQWWITEKGKRVASPSLFWKFSLAGSTLFLVYGILRLDIVIILGQIVSYLVYIRNLQLKGDWAKFSNSLKVVLYAIPIASLIWIFRMADKMSFEDIFLQNYNVFLVIGMIGQLLLNLRFVYQLYYSELRHASLLPKAFWWLSLSGAILIVVYSIHRRDPVLLTAQGLAIIPYLRNIVLSKKKD